MPVTDIEPCAEGVSRTRTSVFNMETIWLQRSSPDVPWGFRLVGGREFGVPLSVQRVTPGSVAAAGLGAGDVILKVGNVMATNLEHNEAMELVKQAGNILQLTIKKSQDPSPAGPMSPASSYSSQQANDYNSPRGYGSNSGYSTTPRNMGSQYQQPQSPQYGTRIEIQRVAPTQSKPPGPQRSYSNSYNNYNDNNGDVNFPDYTIPYKQQEPIHDSPGGPVDLRSANQDLYSSQTNQQPQFSSQTLPRSYTSGTDRDGYGNAPSYDTRSYDSRPQTDTRFSTGMPYQSSLQQKSPSPALPPQQQSSPYQPSYSSTPQGYSNVQSSGPFSPQSYSSPMSPRSQANSAPGYGSADRQQPAVASADLYLSNNQTSPSSYNAYDPSSKHGSGVNAYSTLPHSKPSSNTSNYNVYNSAPQPYSAPKPYTPTQPPSNTFGSTPSSNISSPSAYTPSSPYQPSVPKPYQSPMSPSSGYSSQPSVYNPSVPQPYGRRVSFDQSVQEPRGQHLKSPPPPPVPQSNYDTGYGSSPVGYQRPADQVDSYSPPGISDFGAPAPQRSFSRQSSRGNDPYSGSYGPSTGGPMSPRSDSGSGNYGYGSPGNRGYDPSGVSAGMNNLSMGSPSYEPPAPPAPAPPPPPPPPPSGPPPPPAPPLNNWNNPTPYRRQNYQEEPEEQKIPDQLLNTMLKSSKGGGPKPFSYGIDLSELKKKMGPPTAPKPRRGQQGPQEDDDEPYVPRGPRKPVGQIQTDYFIPRDYETDKRAPPKKPAGQVQTDYFLNKDGGPRAEIDESSLRVNMGTDPKKQSKSFKVLQWMTETDNDDGKDQEKGAEAEPTPKTRRPKDPERRHNADDDEMRFTGLHSKADIPSKAFGRLQKISASDNNTVTQNGQDTLDVGDSEEGVGNYEESSIRYKGKHIPSPSFRVLQTWAENDPDTYSGSNVKKEEEEEDDGMPETLNSDEVVDKRYKGGNIPSKVFKVLQMSVGADTDTPEEPAKNTEPAEASSGQQQQQQPQGSTAPISDF